MNSGGAIGISTITLARSLREEHRITTALHILHKNLAQAGRQTPIVVVDGGSGKVFINTIREIPGIDIQITDKKGLFPQVIKSLTWAKELGARAILYTESDKTLFFPQVSIFLDESEKIIRQDPDFGLILAARSPESFVTYPPVQRYEEQKVNAQLTKLTGLDTDYTYGPRIISPDLIEHLQTLPKNVGWGWLSAAVVIAKKLGKKMHAVTMDFPCPEEDLIETERDKKYRQQQAQDHMYAMKLVFHTFEVRN